MNRLTLAGQVALIVALAIFTGQAINLALALDRQHDQLIDRAAVPAAQRLAIAAEPSRLIDRERRTDRRERRMDRRMERGLERGLERGRAQRRPRIAVGTANPVPESADRLASAEAVLVDALDANGISYGRTAAFLMADGDEASERRRTLVMAAQLEDGRWISLRTPGPRPIGPFLTRMLLANLFIAFLILLPVLWLLRRVGGSLDRLGRRAERFDGLHAEPLDVTGPRDVRALIGSINAMQERIAAMVSEKDVMLGAIGHDLRTPLTALRLEAEAVDDDERRTALIGSIEYLHGQLEAILDLARTDRPVDRNEQADSGAVLAAFAQELAGRAVTIEPGPSALFMGNEMAVRRALGNLVVNGLRYGDRVTVASHADDEHVHFTVTDDGPGIAPDERTRLVRPFERGESSRNRATGGHGLGLAIVNAIVTRHFGALSLEDRADGQPGLAARISFARLSL